MHPHLTEQIATQHETEMRTQAARATGARRTRRTGTTRHPARRRRTFTGNLRPAAS